MQYPKQALTEKNNSPNNSLHNSQLKSMRGKRTTYRRPTATLWYFDHKVIPLLPAYALKFFLFWRMKFPRTVHVYSWDKCGTKRETSGHEGPTQMLPESKERQKILPNGDFWCQFLHEGKNNRRSISDRWRKKS